MADRRSVDKELGFAQERIAERTEAEPTVGSPHEDGAYEDSWYQVLKAQADEAERD
ncbi:MAG: hypothetical protein ACXWXB_08800 [Actinomycetota bacterium]